IIGSKHIKQKSVLAFKELIETDPEVYMLFSDMFSEPPADSSDNPIKYYMDMLRKMDAIIGAAPKFQYNSDDDDDDDEDDYQDPAKPFGNILVYVVATPSGSKAFINDKVNKCLRDILRTWTKFLDSPQSKLALNKKDGWLSPEALKRMPGFMDTFPCDKEDEYCGYKSWNDFFSRKFKTNVRPIANPDDPYTVVAACEASPYYISKNPQFRDKFWIKSQPYSLQQMLNNDPLSETFVGGTVFQAFLSSRYYHRWHAPVGGKIKRAFIKEAAFYADALTAGFDLTVGQLSQRYKSHVNTRAIILIDTGLEKIGTVAFIAIGMSEISSCLIEVKEGQTVKKGDQLGKFQYGGSTYCLLFQKGVKVKFADESLPADSTNWSLYHKQLVRSKIATIEH
ncbi:phosphatidylserine decarboxylase family, partial [Paramuricea clavata]